MGLSEFRPRYFKLTEQLDIAIVTFAMSHISDEDNIEELGHDLFALVDQHGCRKLVLNMSSVEYVTSSVIGKIITLHRKLHRSEGQLIISNLTQGVHDVLHASRLLGYFVVTPTESDAITTLSV